MFWCILGYSSEMCLQHMVPIQKRHFAVGFYPNLWDHVQTAEQLQYLKFIGYLIFGVLCKVVERGDMELELATF